MQAVPPPAIVSPAPSPSPSAAPSPYPSAAPFPSPSPAPLAGPWIAVPRPWGTQAWTAQHDAFVARARQGNVDVLFVGDSITAFFLSRAPDVWDREIAPLGNVVNFGIEGDRTQFVLWRVRNGELDGTNARVVVLMIGTNNLATATPENVARGVSAIVDTIRAKLPNAVVVLNALLPRGAPDDPVRAKLADVNARIAGLADGVHVRWLDAGPGFLDADGTIPVTLMRDKLHPTPDGYAVWSAALRPVLTELLAPQ
ncbi:MAG TPA: GDSL-type esterase/lipase family protein [Candidatus Elarobacter sp.]|nr:GDSL-type esterase/lipase family protein [Candidatus Elarobacter sp.]